VFSNGDMDPWSGGGVLKSISKTVVAVLIIDGAHHNDLMWSHPLDPESVIEARSVERQHMRRWVAEKNVRTRARVGLEATRAAFDQ
jgi:lysosomal Pro-X carboxypeptidase